MKTPTNDPIVAEVRAVRDKHAAQFGYDIKEIFKNIRARQKSSGRKYVRYPARPVAATTTSASTKKAR
ncbi:MAG: hypothetical protein DWQ34_13500 [Planctomycetota bacterium]|nr:MAG: hypothetical protein DWQ29_23880 [Planctomycetota bacterium]REJ92238.1 MAG: hypothetical protein DWQ34_13500 [Planctomycetota bacterium]REK27361.1 MAG: hypothetical protein DWQ41_08340 [Planctomycetota bacterium]REK36617.1 MAG: hypothetical protein DWQ45_08290 [Planctomycetota bacterium]